VTEREYISIANESKNPPMDKSGIIKAKAKVAKNKVVFRQTTYK
tara:strand:- start:12 stop:143 length:132 start_codon:yes stop_codon:yes gene_type:complete